MKSIVRKLSLGALLGASVSAHAAEVLIPNGNFNTPGGADYSYFESAMGVVSFPATGGSGDNGGYGLINNTLGSWGGGLVAPPDNFYPGNQGIPLSSLGLVAGNTYTFSMDMKNFAGTGTGGLKLEAWNGGGGAASNTGDVPASGSSPNWATYSWNYTIPAGTTSIKIVPLITPPSGGSNADSIGFDNIRVNNTPVVPPPIVPVVPNGGFDLSGGGWNVGASWAYFSDGFPASHQAAGGNPGGNAVIDATGAGSYGVLVSNSNAPMSLASLGLTAGKTYTFQMDMKVLAGTNPGGLKVEFVPTATPDMRYTVGQIAALPHPVTDWNTYQFDVTIPPACTQILVVPLWGPGSSVAFDNVKILLPEPFKATIEQGTLVNWTPTTAENLYQVQESTNNTTWTNVGTPFTGTSVTSTFDATKSPFYQVVESAPAFVNAVFNPGFEDTGSSPADGWNNIAAANGGSAAAGSSYTGGFVPDSGSQMLIIESVTGPVDPVPAPDINVRSDQMEITGGASYTLTFRAAHPVKTGGGNPQSYIVFEDGFSNFISISFESFSSLGSAWTTVTRNFTAPANAAYVKVGFIQAVGAGANWQWVTLIDNVSILVPNEGGPIGTLPATTAPGVRINWNTKDGSTYQVRSSTTLGGWTNFGSPVTGDGEIWSVTDTLTPPAKFYQVSETSP
jgi:hypothetical protein